MLIRNRWFRLGAALVVSLGLGTVSSVALGAGFAVNEKGSAATAMGGAFVAVADDLSAMYYNPAGIAENKKFTAYVGGTLIPYFSELKAGSSPYPGDGYQNDMVQQTFVLPNAYMAMPVAENVNIGLGVWAPFGLSTNWENPDQFRGRYLSKRVDLRTFSVSAQVAAKVTDWLSIGAGPEFRLGDVKLQRAAGQYNPYTARFVDFAHVDIVGDGFQSAFGWTAGVIIKPMEQLRLGASFHSAMDIDFEGNTTFYQLPTGAADLDAILASRVPFNTAVPTRTTIQFPSVTMLGASFDINKNLMLSLQADYWTWDVFDETTLAFDTVDGKTVPTSTLPHHWDNVWTFRAGLRYKPSDSFYVGLGVLYDQTPQPDEDTGPLLPDGNRTGYSIGAGFKMGKNTSVELSNLALFFHERTTTTNHDNFNATYKTFADLIVLNLRHSF